MAAASEKASRAIAARFSLGGRDANVIGRTDADPEVDTGAGFRGPAGVQAAKPLFSGSFRAGTYAGGLGVIFR